MLFAPFKLRPESAGRRIISLTLIFVLIQALPAGCGGQLFAGSSPAAATLAGPQPPGTTPRPRATVPLPAATVAAGTRPTPEAKPVVTSPPALPTFESKAAPDPLATATPNPYAALTIDALAARQYGGGLLEIVDTLETTESFTRYLIKYPSDGLAIYGFMNVPHEGDKFPIAILLHGYIDPAEYEVVPYTRRYADALAEAGYFVIHPNLRNYPPSDSGPDPYRTGYAIDVLNLIAVIREQSRDPLGTLRRADAEDINLWGHSMGGGVALRVITVNHAPYLRAAVLYGSMSGDEAKNYAMISRWTQNRRGAFELAATPEMIRAISPINHLDRIEARVAVHHSRADDVVPVEWSEELCARLDELAQGGQIPFAPECNFYDNQPHTFRGDGDRLFLQRTIAFFDQN